jgi:hypothetical protein
LPPLPHFIHLPIYSFLSIIILAYLWRIFLSQKLMSQIYINSIKLFAQHKKD